MTGMRLKILILGGYGTFGARLAQLLADEDRLTLLIAGRSKQRAEQFCGRLSAKAALQPVRFDRDANVYEQLAASRPDIVVDASGPFQSYGEDPYRVVRAAIALGIHYLDLADSSQFVVGVAALDAEARAGKVVVLSGVSSVPVLTAAVVRHLSRDFPPIRSISAGIATSPLADVGLSVVRAMASYAGKPVALLRDGKLSVAYAFTEARSRTIAPPGRLGLKSRRFSLADVPDLIVLPRIWPKLNSIWFGAGPAPETLHRAFGALAWLVRLKILPSLAPLAVPMHRVSRHLRWGEHRSGMFVSVSGVRGDGAPVERAWHLVAEGDDGPFIPSMPAAVIIRRCLEGRYPAAGARPAANEVELHEYEMLFAQRKISTGCREASPEQRAQPLYRRLLGEAWDALPEPMRRVHDLSDRLVAKGRAGVERGRGILARLIAAAVGFPAAGNDVPVEVHFRASQGREYWERNFAGRTFVSTQEAGRGRFEYLLCEKFGWCLFGMAPVIERGRLRLVLRRWSILGLPLPVSWAPFGDAYEYAEDGKFRFHVEISHPLTGPIVTYQGWLVPQALACDKARQEPRNPALVGIK